MMAKDTTPILKHQEDVDLEAGDVFPHLLVLRPRPVSHQYKKKSSKEAGTPDLAFRLRMICLITIASLALVTIVMISEQLISRHLGLNQRFVEDHVVLEVEMPGDQLGFQPPALDVQMPDLDVQMSEFDVVRHEQFPTEEEIEIINADGVQVVKQTLSSDLVEQSVNLAEQDLAGQNLDLGVEDLDVHNQFINNLVDDQESSESEDYYDDQYDEDDYDEDDYNDDDYNPDDYDENDYNEDNYKNHSPADFLGSLQSEIISDNISLDDIEHIKAVLNNQDGSDAELVW